MTDIIMSKKKYGFLFLIFFFGWGGGVCSPADLLFVVRPVAELCEL